MEQPKFAQCLHVTQKNERKPKTASFLEQNQSMAEAFHSTRMIVYAQIIPNKKGHREGTVL